MLAGMTLLRGGAAARKLRSLSTLSPVELIMKKRDGGQLSRDDIGKFVTGFSDGQIADYQMASMLMAIYQRGMTDQETADLTLAMAHSGRVADLSSLAGAKVDKHSTGGVGDKVSLILAPLAASFGMVVPMMSGRGLGHTGGTLDKLEAIPGMSCSVETDRFLEMLGEIGCAVIAPTADIAPVDKAIYALRDVTATVESLPLLCSSIMSKKLAENPDALVLDVKTGRGAFLKEFDESVALAKSMVKAGENAGIATTAILTSMDQPLGRTVGNWLETREAIDIMAGATDGVEDVYEVTVAMAGQMLLMGGGAESLERGCDMARENLANGKALDVFEKLVVAQGGDGSYVRDPDSMPEAAHRTDVVAAGAGHVQGIDALEIGLTGVGLGAGRQKVDDTLDMLAGIVFSKKVGDVVKPGDVLATIHCGDPARLAAGAARVSAAIEVGAARPELPKLISHVLDSEGLREW